MVANFYDKIFNPNLSQDYVKPAKPYTDKYLAFLLGEVQLFLMLFPFTDFFVTFGRWFNAMPIINLLSSLLLGLSVFYLLHVKKIGIKTNEHYLLFAFCAFMVVSLYWVDPYMKGDAKSYVIRTILTVIQTLAIVQVFSERGDQLLHSLKRFAIIVTVMSFLFINLFPDDSNWFLKSPERHQSFFSSPNNLGQFLAFAFIIINFYRWKENGIKALVLLNLLLVFIAYKCDSMTSQIGVFICIAAYHFRFLLKILYPLVIAAGIGLTLFTHYRQNNNAEQVEFANRDMTFTGRSDVWDILINDMERNHKTIWGVGAGGYWGVEKTFPNNTIELLDWEPRQGHNGWLDIRVMLGWVGLGVLVIFLLHFLYGLYQKKRVETILFFIPLIILINNMTESTLFRAKHFYFVLFMLIYWYAAFKHDKNEPQKEINF
jgi:hypothetical protein